jgi:magnesium chelatase family protein
VPDLAEVRGQARARRAAEVAAAGGHNLLFVGPPGTGKTLLARRLPGLLPPLSREEAMEVAVIVSATGRPFAPERFGERPFRAPHHTASAAALTGGGALPRPGEVTLAHHGVLFLDELPEFDRRALESLREPLEEGWLTVSRARAQRSFPARFILVAAMNPCPCGHLGEARAQCRCSAELVARYRARVSGPLLDRVDLVVDMPRPPAAVLSSTPGESTAVVAARVAAARERQRRRQGAENARVARPDRLLAALGAAERRLLEQAAEHFGLSLRAVHRALRVARTIADLEATEGVGERHLQEALSFRLPALAALEDARP